MTGTGSPRGEVLPRPPARLLERPELLRRLALMPAPVVVLDAPAGMGKSVLLAALAAQWRTEIWPGAAPPEPQGRAPRLWDIPRGLKLAEALPETATGLIIAKRPTTHLPGLARAEAYGRAMRLGAADLLFSEAELAASLGAEAARRILAETGGWPFLYPAAVAPGPTAPDVAAFLAEEYLAPMSPRELVALAARLAQRAGRPAPPAVDGPYRDDAGEALPEPVLAACREPMERALAAAMEDRRATRRGRLALAEAEAGQGMIPEAILSFQAAGEPERALDLFSRSHGDFFVHLYGPAALDAVLAGFTADFERGNGELIAGRAMQALKRGEVALAQRLIADSFGPAANDPDRLFAPDAAFSLPFRLFRVVMMIYEDRPIPDALLSQLYALLAEVPADAHLLRGGFYNSVLVYFIGAQRLAEAEDAALRAAEHYRRADVPLLIFYIYLHRAFIRLLLGAPAEARKLADAAAGELDRVPFDSPGDRLLLALLTACIDYEVGDIAPLVRFLDEDLDAFSHGEIWPALLEVAFHYGSQALSARYSTNAALGFLDRWRSSAGREGRLARMIELREILILQSGNRWHEAGTRLLALPGGPDRVSLRRAGAKLAEIADRDDLARVLVWLRQMVYEMTPRDDLAGLLMALAGNRHLTARQRVGVETWLALAEKRRRNPGAARAILTRLLESAARSGAVAPLIEERAFVDELLATSRIRTFLALSPHLRPILRRLQESAEVLPDFGTAAGLTRRETRVLNALSEGASNKFIAKALGISEATVKFHLANIYRKLGCRNRREAIARALAQRRAP